MAKKVVAKKAAEIASPARPVKPSALVDTRVIYCGDNLEQLKKLPDACVDLIYIDPPFNSNRNYEVFWGETKEKRAFDDRHESTQAYIDFMRPRCVNWPASSKRPAAFIITATGTPRHYVKVMLDQIFGENNFQNEIVWKRQHAHSDAKQGEAFGRVHDTIFLLQRRRRITPGINTFTPHSRRICRNRITAYDDEAMARRYQLDDMTAARRRDRPKAIHDYEGL